MLPTSMPLRKRLFDESGCARYASCATGYAALAIRDLAGMADLTEVMTTMTHLAEVTIRCSLEQYHNWATQPDQFGSPIKKSATHSNC